jgi:hypothetical protein
MDFDKGFKEDDIKKVVDFLNAINKYASFNMNQQELIEYFKLLSHMQHTILPKMRDMLLEFKKLHKAEEDTQEIEE